MRDSRAVPEAGRQALTTDPGGLCAAPPTPNTPPCAVQLMPRSPGLIPGTCDLWSGGAGRGLDPGKASLGQQLPREVGWAPRLTEPANWAQAVHPWGGTSLGPLSMKWGCGGLVEGRAGAEQPPGRREEGASHTSWVRRGAGTHRNNPGSALGSGQWRPAHSVSPGPCPPQTHPHPCRFSAPASRARPLSHASSSNPHRPLKPKPKDLLKKKPTCSYKRPHQTCPPLKSECGGTWMAQSVDT